MSDFFENLFTAGGFMPHGHCYFWRPDILWTHVISDGFIALSYFCIPICLMFIYLRRKDVGLRWLVALFALFIIGCGITHIMGIITVWNPIYRLDGTLKAITALASVGTAIALLKLTPNLITIPTKQDWDEVNEELRQQLVQLEEKDEELRQQLQKLEEQSEALQKSEERYQNLMNLFDGVVIYANEKVVFVNPAATQLLGAPVTPESTGKSTANSVHPDSIAHVQAQIQRLKRHETASLIEDKITRPDGTVVNVETTSIPITYNGKPAVQTVVRDITERKQGEQKLRRTLDELKQRNHELDNYVYKVSHDLRAPLTSILGLINIMKIEENPVEKERYVGLIENRAHKLDQFIQSILSHSKTLNTDVSVRPVDFQKLIHEAFEELRYMPNSEKITLSVDVTSDQVFYGDELRMSIILKNFISNAIKYLNPQHVQPFVNVRIAIDAEDAEIIIADNGQGIEPAYVDKIFNMFFRATEKSDGSGLGLYIVRQTIERLGGSIRVESKLGKGTTFFIRVPNGTEQLVVSQ